MADINIPKDLLLPIPEDSKEEDLYKTLKDYSNAVNDSLENLYENAGTYTVAGDGLTDTAGTLSVNVDDVTIEIDGSDDLAVKSIDGSLLTGLADIPSSAGVIPSANLPTVAESNPHIISASAASGTADDGTIWIQYT